MKNIILTDFNPKEENWSLLRHLNIYSSNWHCKTFATSSWNNGIKKILKYIVFFIYPLRLLFGRRKYAYIISWQQFYGLNFAFWARFFKLRKRNKLLVLTFIYKAKKGFAGRLYHRYMNYIVTSHHIDYVICYSQNEITYYRHLFPNGADKFQYIPLGMEKIPLTSPPETYDYIFSTGRSNRDYTFLTEAFANTQYTLKIACDYLEKTQRATNIEILDDCHREAMIDVLKNCFCVCIALDNPHISAGQLVILQATQLGKPVIITQSNGVIDYIIDGYNGYIIEKDKVQLLTILDRIYNDRQLYNELSRNCRKSFIAKHSMKSMAKHLIDLTHQLDNTSC